MGSMEAAHTVDGTSRRRRGRTQIKIGRTRGVSAQGWPEEDLAHGECAAGNVAADKIGVHSLKPRGRKCAAGKDAVTEAGGKALDLGFDATGHVDGRSIGDVAVGPQYMLALGARDGSKSVG